MDTRPLPYQGGIIYSSPAVVNGVVYFGSYDGNVYAIGQNTGGTSTSSSSGLPNIIYSVIAQSS